MHLCPVGERSLGLNLEKEETTLKSGGREKEREREMGHQPPPTQSGLALRRVFTGTVQGWHKTPRARTRRRRGKKEQRTKKNRKNKRRTERTKREVKQREERRERERKEREGVRESERSKKGKRGKERKTGKT